MSLLGADNRRKQTNKERKTIRRKNLSERGRQREGARERRAFEGDFRRSRGLIFHFQEINSFNVRRRRRSSDG